jgi:U3 small nucleolar RNA-associated protein 14
MAKKRKNTKANNATMNQTKVAQKPLIKDHVTESEDEEIDEDEAFNSEDERKYGSFFVKDKTKVKGKKTEPDDGSSDGESVTSGSDDGSDDEDDDADDDDDGGQYMLELLEKLDAPKRSDAASGTMASHMAQLPESEFSTALTQTKDGSSASKTLTLDKLMQGLENSAGFAQLQKTFQKVAKGAATPAPLNRVITDRTQRKMVYQQESKDISGWTTAVQDNRQAETLDFKPNKERVDIVTRDLLVEKFEPTTPFEKELEEALLKAGQADEQKMLEAEEAALQDDLGANKLTMEEYKKRRGQLAQMRALMSYYEQRRHHMKKIKSKKYRRIRKRQRERLKDGALDAALEDDEDNDLAKELQEKEEVARITERMSLAHKNTSKWARRILKRGNKVDTDTRRALSAQLQRGDDLRKKMMGGTGDSDDDDEGGSGGEEEDLVESARKILSSIEADDDLTRGGKSSLFKLAFMQRGVEKQRERAKEEARKLLRELEANERDDYDATAEDDNIGSDDDDNRGSHKKKKKKKKKDVASSKEMAQVLEKGGLVASSLEFGNSNSITTTGGIDIELPPTLAAMTAEKKHDRVEAWGGSHAQDKNKNVTEHTTTLSLPIDGKEDTAPPKQARRNDKKRKSSDVAREDQNTEEEANPWMSVMDSWAAETAAPIKKNKVSRYSGVNKAGVVEVDGAADILLTSSDSSKRTNGAIKSLISASATDPSGANSTPEKDKKIANMTQEELIRKAFVSISEQDIDEEFRKEKDDAADESSFSRKQAKQEKDSKDTMGWGSWAGAGAPPPSKSRKTLPKKLQAPIFKNEQQVKRKDEKKPNVIINEKRIKKTANTFLLGDIPHPYSSRAEYEQAMMGGVGKEWNVTSAYKNMTRPEILTRPGKMILPISKRAKESRPAAKF